MKTRKSKMVDDEEMMEELKLAQPVVFASTPGRRSIPIHEACT